LQLKETAEERPFAGVMVTVDEPDCPGVKLRLAGLSPIVKSAGGGVLTVMTTTDDVEPAIEAAPPYWAVIELLPTGRAFVV